MNRGWPSIFPIDDLKKCLKDEKANIYVNGHVVGKKMKYGNALVLR